MVHVPESLGDSGFHRESHEEAHADLRSGKPASLEVGSPTTPLNQDRSADRHSFGRRSTDGTEEGPATDLEEKPLPPPQVPSGTPADHDWSRDLQDESPSAKAIQTLVSKSSTKKKSRRSKPLRKKMKAPGSDADDQDEFKTVCTDESLEIAYHNKRVNIFSIKNSVMQIIKTKIISDLKGPVRKPTARSSKLEAAKALLNLIKEGGIIAGSFDANDLFDTRLSAINTVMMSIFDLLKPFVGEKNVTSKVATGSTDDMLKSLPALVLEDQTGTSSRYESATEEVDTDSADDPPRMTLGPSGAAMLRQRGDHETKRVTDVIAPNTTQGSNAKLESYFQAAMTRFLKEQQGAINPVIAPAEDRAVDMESVGSPDQHPNLHEYDPDDPDLDPPRRAAVASASATITGRSTSVPRIRVSAMSELKDRTTRSTWKDLLSSFQVQYCGRGVSVARQYYHAHKRSDESLLEYLSRLNVVGLMARLQIKDGPSEVRREHVEHFIETLDDREFADHLALLRIPDADTLEEALRSRQRAKARQSKAVYGSIKPRQKNNMSLKRTPVDRMTKQDYVVSTSQHLETMKGSKIKIKGTKIAIARRPETIVRHLSDARTVGRANIAILGAGGRLTCEKCGRKGHPSDRCLFTCKACGDIHEAGKCTMEEFYNLIRQWYNPTKHTGMLPETAEKIIYVYVEKQSEATVNQLINPIDNTCDLLEKSITTVSSLHQVDEYARSSVMMALDISPGESRGYWKYHWREVSVLDTTFARKVGCHIDESQTLECEGVRQSPYKIEGRTRLKITLAGSLVYFFDAWVGPPTRGPDLILGMDFMVPAGIRLDLADGAICLPDEVRLQMAGRRPLYGDKVEHVCWKDHYWIDVGQTAEIRLRGQTSNQYKLWVTRGDRWVRTITVGPGRTRYLQVTNVRRMANLAYQATTDEISEVDINEQTTEPAVEHHEYVTPTAILPRPAKAIQNVEIAGDGDVSLPLSKCTSDQGKIDPVKTNDHHAKIETNIGDPTMDDEVCIKEGGILFAEDVEDQIAVLPEATATTEEVKLEDLQIGDASTNTQEEIERLVQIIWKRKHLLIGKGNASPPAAKGVVCDIDVGNAKPVAQRCRKVAIQFREKLYQLIKGLLSARMIRHSTFPWASPIVVIIKKNGIDIRLSIDYRLVNSLTRLMVYPMPLINDLLDDLDKVLWYCSLDMASGFWVVPMTDRARSISAFITPFGLFEWNRMPFGLKNAPQIYQRLLDNALYGFLKVTQDQDRSDRKDVFETGEPDLERNETSIYIDDILVTGRSWDALCEKVEKLLDACDEWNLSISVAKSFWGRQQVDYLGHRVSSGGLKTHPKDLSALLGLPFPTNLRSMQSFLESLNYYSRFIEDFAIYASVLYELREADFYEIA
ncbi:Reverse transcriptase [Phytophthora palmivora]|uniref:Reverse transcriptase n=1 Tax=Phytophthora palmivora TaxID=4796 RepID=A0A2P4YFG7_9STRA|nr:Reverse transcriptase [Phytophthora palmivora]